MSEDFYLYFHLRETRSWGEGFSKGRQSQRYLDIQAAVQCTRPAPALPTFTTLKGHFPIAPVGQRVLPQKFWPSICRICGFQFFELKGHRVKKELVGKCQEEV